MTEAALPLDHPFWHFSLGVYRDKGVQAECLDVQERLGVDVNLLLFCAYLGTVEGIQLTPPDLQSIADRVSSWHAEVVRSLRSARRVLKPWAADDTAIGPEASALRKHVQNLEIKAEQIEQAILWQWFSSQTLPRANAEGLDVLAANVDALLRFYGAGGSAPDSQPRLPHLIRASKAWKSA